MRVDYGMAAKFTAGAAIAGLAWSKVGEKEKEGENEAKKAWVTPSFARHVGVILLANEAAKNGLLCKQVAVAVQTFAALKLTKTAIESWASESVIDVTAKYMNPLRSLAIGAAVATILSHSKVNVDLNKF